MNRASTHTRQVSQSLRGGRAAARDQELRQALKDHAAGSLDEAARRYQQLHADNPHDSEVIFLMGVLCCDLGLFEPACCFLEEALAIAAEFPEARAQLTVALNAAAELAICVGSMADARRHLERALHWTPGDAASLQCLGRLDLLQGAAAESERHFLESLQRRPDHAETLNWLGLAQLQIRKYAAAEVSLRHALRLRPDLNQSLNNLGLALYHQGKLTDAIALFEQALLQDPAYRHAGINLALALRLLGRHAEARDALETVLALHPDEVDALNNLGVIFQDQGEAQLALATLQRAIELAPATPAIRWNLSMTQLLLGDFKDGWANHEARWEGCAHIRGSYRHPAERAWRGEDLNGKRLLLWSEQGFGDTLQFIRFAQDVARHGAVVSVQAPPELVPLLLSCPGVSAVCTTGQPLSPYDFHCPLLSLPYRLGLSMTASDLHGAAPYLYAPPDRIDHWRQRMSPHAGLKVGLVWAGNARLQSAELAAIDRRRSLSLNHLWPLVSVPNCTFYSLQKGVPAAELQGLAAQSIHDFSADWGDFADTAAFLVNLDLVISVDTAVAHLAGALGKPVWLLNRYDTCWRWLLERDDSPWYRNLRQFRQPDPGKWDPVITAVADALATAARPALIRP